MQRIHLQPISVQASDRRGFLLHRPHPPRPDPVGGRGSHGRAAGRFSSASGAGPVLTEPHRGRDSDGTLQRGILYGEPVQPGLRGRVHVQRQLSTRVQRLLQLRLPMRRLHRIAGAAGQRLRLHGADGLLQLSGHDLQPAVRTCLYGHRKLSMRQLLRVHVLVWEVRRLAGNPGQRVRLRSGGGLLRG